MPNDKQTDVKNWPPHMRVSQASAYSGVSVSHLAKLRMEVNRGKGPVYSKVAGCVVYRKADLDKWLADNLIGAAA
ncbi:helix-turn-helix domain-containing protein [Sulfitobacter sp. W027]|uniref:helix-turn-helix domain-containing protein n=1 Tax=Sulfitobacter sp. W027 TaxID=2867025 RepID=UPI0021A6690E|nr:helix-turn-helix domain-containing protein [Sulfitobacter sp. W027]UWR33737.1 helix-turn-helix domain-containing protein [Sulfitobacter sp. W027]